MTDERTNTLALISLLSAKPTTSDAQHYGSAWGRVKAIASATGETTEEVLGRLPLRRGDVLAIKHTAGADYLASIHRCRLKDEPGFGCVCDAGNLPHGGRRVCPARERIRPRYRSPTTFARHNAVVAAAVSPVVASMMERFALDDQDKKDNCSFGVRCACDPDQRAACQHYRRPSEKGTA